MMLYLPTAKIRSTTRKSFIAMMLLVCISMAGINVVSAFAENGVSVRASVAPDVFSEIANGNDQIVVTVTSINEKENVKASLGELNLSTVDSFSQLPVLAVNDVTEESVNTIATWQNVAAIEPVRTLNNDAVDYLRVIDGFEIPASATNPTPLTGKGTIVGVIDSGLNTNDNFFMSDNSSSRIVAQACIQQEKLDFSPCNTTPGKEAHIECESELKSCWHGHAVSVLAIGAFISLSDDAGTLQIDMQGTAPEAGLSFFRIADSDTSGPTNISILAAFNKFLADARTNPEIAPDVINISIGFDAKVDPNCSLFPSLEIAVEALTSAGITVVASSGNEGNKSYVSSPACFESAIAVGATDYTLDADGNIQSEKIAQFTNTSSLLDVVAPGTGLLGATPSPEHFYTEIQGTSFAAPIVAGAVAVLREADPTLTPAEIRSLLVRTGDPVRDPATGNSFPRINLAKAVAALEEDEPEPSTTVVTTTTPTSSTTTATTSTTIPSSTTATTVISTVGTTTPVFTEPSIPVSVAGVSVTNSEGTSTLPFTGTSTTGQLTFAAIWILLAGVMLLCFKEGFTQRALLKASRR